LIHSFHKQAAHQKPIGFPLDGISGISAISLLEKNGNEKNAPVKNEPLA